MVKYWTFFPLFQEKSKNVSFNLLFIVVLEVLVRRQEKWKVNKKQNKNERNSWVLWEFMSKILKKTPKEKAIKI